MKSWRGREGDRENTFGREDAVMWFNNTVTALWEPKVNGHGTHAVNDHTCLV